MKNSYPKRFEKAQKIFRDRGGVLKTGEALSGGIHPRTLYEMQRSGILEQLTRVCIGLRICRHSEIPTWYQSPSR